MKNENRMESYENYVSQQPHVSFMQSKHWAAVKEGWLSERLLLTDANGHIHAAVQLLIKQIPLLHTAFVYVPRGPVCAYDDTMLLKSLTEQIRQCARRYHAFMVRLDPMIAYDDTHTIQRLTSLGYRYDPYRSEDDQIQSQKNYLLPIHAQTKEQLFTAFHPKWRYNIRLAVRKGVRCVVDNNRLDDFDRLMQETGQRDGFCIRSKAYFRQLLTAFGKQARLYLCDSSEGLPLAGAIAIRFGDRVSYLYGASTSQHRELMPNYLLQWNMISWAADTGCQVYDFMGIPHFEDVTHPNYGVYRFKKGFGGTPVRYAGEFDLILSETKYRLVRFLLRRKGYRKI